MLTAEERRTARVKVACINWSHDDAPHAMSYVSNVDDCAFGVVYHATWDQAMDRADRLARLIRGGAS